MSDDSSQEKNLPATPRKIQKSREKGQVPRSKDTVTAVSLTLVVIYLTMGRSDIFVNLKKIFSSFDKISYENFHAIWPRAIKDTFESISDITAGAMAAAAIGALLAGILVTKGIIFSMESIKPKFDKLNPMQGLKKLFALRNLVEFTKALIKLIILLAVVSAIIWAQLKGLFGIPFCGANAGYCLQAIFWYMVSWVLGSSLILFFFAGLIDIIIQNRLFLRDMKMSQKEMKDEMKETYGDPVIRQKRKEFAQEDTDAPRSQRTGTPTLIITGNGVAVSLRYVRDETPVPIILASAQGPDSARLIAESQNYGAKLYNDPALAQKLYEKARPGQYLPQTFFKEVIEAILKSMQE